jgi:phospholipase C
MIVVSPWSRGGWVNSQQFDHTSIIRFLEARFGVTEPNISAWRRAMLGDLTSAFNFRRPNHKPFPVLPSLTREEADGIRSAQEKLPQVATPFGAAGTFPVQPAGVRPSRALPYVPHVEAVVDPGTALVRLRFGNAGTVGVVYHVYDRLRLDAVPRRYAVEAGTSLEDAWSADAGGRYDLWILGPNGFLRHVAGTTTGGAAVRPEVEVRYGRSLKITLSNDGDTDCTFTVRANAYRRAGADTVRVSAGKHRTRPWPLRRGWYDVTVTCDADSGFVRRLAGRVEHGRPSITDPAMGNG